MAARSSRPSVASALSGGRAVRGRGRRRGRRGARPAGPSWRPRSSCGRTAAGSRACATRRRCPPPSASASPRRSGGGRWRSAVGAASVAEIDRLNIYHATHLAMRRAIARLGGHDHVLVDGLPIAGFEVDVGPVHGDRGRRRARLLDRLRVGRGQGGPGPADGPARGPLSRLRLGAQRRATPPPSTGRRSAELGRHAVPSALASWPSSGHAGGRAARARTVRRRHRPRTAAEDPAARPGRRATRRLAAAGATRSPDAADRVADPPAKPRGARRRLAGGTTWPGDPP